MNPLPFFPSFPLSSLFSVNKNGKKRTLTMTRQCCYGYGRARGATYATPCEKIDIKDIAATAEDMGAKEFISRAKSTGLMDMFAARRNFTVFLPTDEAFNSFSDLLQSESVSEFVSLC